MKKILLLVLLFINLAVQAQVRSTQFDTSKELCFAFGTSYYLGEVNPYRHFGTRLLPGGGLCYRQNFNKRWALRLGLLYGQVLAHDSDSRDAWIQNRNLHFMNRFWEGSVQWELNYFNYQVGKSNEWISPYLFAGIAYYSMKPQAQYKGVWYDLQPIGTEGQGIEGLGKKYNLAGIAIPFGVGLKMNVVDIFAISLEWGMRKTWTDYFDDISTTYADPGLLEDEGGDLAVEIADQSFLQEGPEGDNGGMQRGDPGRKDWYSFALLSINVRIDKPKGTCFK